MGERHYFFDSTSFMASTSSNLSANKRLSLLFFDSGSRKHLASLTSSPSSYFASYRAYRMRYRDDDKCRLPWCPEDLKGLYETARYASGLDWKAWQG